MHAHHDMPAHRTGHAAGHTASMISIVAQATTCLQPRATRLLDWSLATPGMSGRVGHTGQKMGGRLRRRIEVSPH